MVNINDKQRKELLVTNFFIEFNESRIEDESEEELEEEYDNTNYAMYYNVREYTKKSEKEKEEIKEENARKKWNDHKDFVLNNY